MSDAKQPAGGVSRRNFMKTAGTAAAGVTIATKFSPFAYAANEKLRVACIGTGGQGTHHIRDGLSGTPDLVITAVCDVFEPHQKAARIYSMISNAGIALPPGTAPGDLDAEQKAKAKAAVAPNVYYDYKEMLAQEELDAVIISTPLHLHAQMTLDCLDAGKYVFCEKTMTQTLDESRAIVEKCHEKGLFCAVGHQRRYDPRYNLAMYLVFNQYQLGRINHIQTQWHRNHYWRRQVPMDYELSEREAQYIEDLEHHLNWRMYEEISGGLFTELATHQTDVANWFMMGVPSRVFASGGIDYWRDGRQVDDNISISYVYTQEPSDPGFTTIDKRSRRQSISQINKGYKVRHEHSNILANAHGSAREVLQGDYGTLILSELPNVKCVMYAENAISQNMEAKPGEDDSVVSGGSRYATPEELLQGVPLVGNGTRETSDVYQFRAFAKGIREGKAPRNNEMVGLTTTITALAAMESRKTGQPVDIPREQWAFNFDTPSFYDYEWDPEQQNPDPASLNTPQGTPAQPEPNTEDTATSNY